MASRAHSRPFLTQSSAPRMGGRSRVSTTMLPSLTWCRDWGLRRRSRCHPLPCPSMLHRQWVRQLHVSPALRTGRLAQDTTASVAGTLCVICVHGQGKRNSEVRAARCYVRRQAAAMLLAGMQRDQAGVPWRLSTYKGQG